MSELLVALALAAAMVTQAPSPPGGEAIAIASTALGESRTVWVRAAPACRQAVSCDLLVVLDGHALFPLATAYADVMQAMGRMKPLVIVGVPSPSQGSRVKDFTSAVSDADRGRYPQAGGARHFLEFLQREVVPLIASQYRLSGNHTLAGHSLAGLFAVEALALGAGFANYIAISPTLGWNGEQVLNALTPGLGKPAQARRMFVSMANDAPAYLAAFARLEQVIAGPQTGWLQSSLRRFAEEDHVTTVAPALQAGMKWLFVTPAP